MKIYKVVKREENPTITLSDVNMEYGFMIVTAEGEAVGIIVYDSEREEYMLINNFYDSFKEGICPCYCDEKLENLMKRIKSDYVAPVEFNYIKVES